MPTNHYSMNPLGRAILEWYLGFTWTPDEGLNLLFNKGLLKSRPFLLPKI